MLLKFDDDSLRDQFMRKVERERPDISQALRAARRLPHVIATGLSGEQQDWISHNLQGTGETFADVQFEPFSR
jgi:hypothetical protein